MYSNKEYRKYQYFVAPDWPGGIYATATFAGKQNFMNEHLVFCWLGSVIDLGSKVLVLDFLYWYWM